MSTQTVVVDRHSESIYCPKCLPEGPPPTERPRWRWLLPHRRLLMDLPMKGRTDVVMCYECGHEEPRIVMEERDKPEPKRRGGPKPKRPWRGEGPWPDSWSAGKSQKVAQEHAALEHEGTSEF